jgi:DNA-binding MarR family transcriptional regulator
MKRGIKMSKKQEFIDFVEDALMSKVDVNEVPENVMIYWEALKNKEEKEKPPFTDNGKLILQFLRDNEDTTTWKARDIAEGLFVSSRTVSGSIRKLVNDGYVEKVSKDPVIYSITDLGKKVEII